MGTVYVEFKNLSHECEMRYRDWINQKKSRIEVFPDILEYTRRDSNAFGFNKNKYLCAFKIKITIE
jgi:hypothetical protein